MRHRWPLILALCSWLLILLLPPLRALFFIQLRGGSEVHRGWAFGPFVGADFGNKPVTPPIAEDDYRALIVKQERDFFKADKKKFFTEYDQFLARFPDEKLLIARRLLLTMDWMRTDRLAGELDPNYIAFKTPPAPAPERDPKLLNFTRADIEAALKLARRGQQLEPRNAFFDWAEFYLLLISWQDAKAWPILAKASRKTEFNAYESQWAQAVLHYNALLQGRPQTVEETIAVLAGLLTRNTIGMRLASPLVTWQAIKAERQGDTCKMLRLRGDWARLMFLQARYAYQATHMMSYMARAEWALSTDKAQTNTKEKTISQNDPHLMEKLYLLRAQAFLDYANAQGRADLAHEMRSLCIEAGQRQDAFRHNFFESKEYYYGVTARRLAQAVALWWGACFFLLLAPLYFLWWLILSVSLRWACVPVVETKNRVLLRTTLIGFTMPVACLVIALLLGAAGNTLSIPKTPLSLQIINSLWRRWPEAVGYFNGFLLMLGLLLPGLSATYLCLRAAPAPLPKRPRKERLRAVRLSTILTDSAWTFFIFASAFLWLNCINGYNVFNFPDALVLRDLKFSPLLPQSAFALGVAFLWLRPLFAPSAEKPLAAYRLRLLQRTLGLLLVAASVSYCLVLCASVPIRNQLDKEVQNVVQHGELWIFKQSAGGD